MTEGRKTLPFTKGIKTNSSDKLVLMSLESKDTALYERDYDGYLGLFLTRYTSKDTALYERD